MSKGEKGGKGSALLQRGRKVRWPLKLEFTMTLTSAGAELQPYRLWILKLPI